MNFETLPSASAAFRCDYGVVSPVRSAVCPSESEHACFCSWELFNDYLCVRGKELMVAVDADHPGDVGFVRQLLKHVHVVAV